MGKRSIYYKSNKKGWIGTARMKKRNGYKRPVAVPKRLLRTLRTGGWSNRKGELKYKDISSAIYGCDTTGSVTLLNGVAQATGADQRIGKQIYCKSIQIQGIIRPQDDATSSHLARVMLVWDHQPNTTLATITQILDASTSISGLKLDNRERFTVLRDQKFSVAANVTSGGVINSLGQTAFPLDMFVSLGNKKTTYSDTDAAIGSLSTGALLLVTVSDVATGSGSTLTCTTRLRYYDN